MKDLNQHILESTILSGGFSVNLNLVSPVNGYMVSINPEFEAKLDLKCNQVSLLDEISQFIVKNNIQLRHKNNFIGSWICNDMIYLDVSINVINFNEAIFLAKKHGQIAIFDLNNKEEMFVKNRAA